MIKNTEVKTAVYESLLKAFNTIKNAFFIGSLAWLFFYGLAPFLDFHGNRFRSFMYPAIDGIEIVSLTYEQEKEASAKKVWFWANIKKGSTCRNQGWRWWYLDDKNISFEMLVSMPWKDLKTLPQGTYSTGPFIFSAPGNAKAFSIQVFHECPGEAKLRETSFGPFPIKLKDPSMIKRAIPKLPIVYPDLSMSMGSIFSLLMLGVFKDDMG